MAASRPMRPPERPGRGARGMAEITDHEAEQVKNANRSGKPPVVFVHGLWLLPNSWDRWRTYFEEKGYATVVPGWPDDPDTVAQAKENPEVFAHKSVGQIADHFQDVISDARREAGRDRSLVRWTAHADPRRPRLRGGVGRDRPCTVPGRAAASRSRRSSRRSRCCTTRSTTVGRCPSPTSSSATPSPTR